VNGSSQDASSARTRARVRASTASLTTGLATAAVPLLAGGAPARPQLVLAGAAIMALVVALAGWAPGFTLAAIALGGEYAVRLNDRHDLDGLVIVEAVALLATVELGLRALEARSLARRDTDVRRAATVRLVAMIAGAAVSATVVLAVGSRQLPAPSAMLAVGLAAAVMLLIAAESLRRRVTRVPST
jgi:hypothetical protein